MAVAFKVELSANTTELTVFTATILHALPQGSGSRVTFTNGSSFDVKQTPDEIEGLANA